MIIKSGRIISVRFFDWRAYMSENICPEGEEVRRAFKWVCAELKARNPKPLRALMDEACFRFNLSPSDSIILEKSFKDPDKPCD